MILSADQYAQMLERMPILCVDGLVLDERGHFLLVRRRNAPRQGEWWVPGGRVLKGETLDAAFCRKMREEIGLDVRILMPVGYFEIQHEDDPRGGPAGVHQVSVVFAAVATGGAVRLDAQSSECGYFEHLPEPFARFQSFNAWRLR